jgi:vitamin B12 transporter
MSMRRLGSARRPVRLAAIWLILGTLAAGVVSGVASAAPAEASVGPSPATLDSLPAPAVAGRDTLWWAEPVLVVGSRVCAALPGALRAVGVLTAEDLARLPGRSPAEWLALAGGVSVGQRQQYGAQADLSIRGSTFEQVQVLLDGLAIGDPQTGHHLMNLPLGAGDVSRLEVLRGHGSSLYGANAFGGIVNVVTRRPAARSGGELALTGGGLGLWEARGSLDWAVHDGGLRTRLSAGRLRTDGHRPGSDVDVWTGTAHVASEGRSGAGDLFLGYARRAFGARDFYAPTEAFERTESRFGAVRWRRDFSRRLTIEPIWYVRSHRDRFDLWRADPNRYRNDHLTRRTGAELRTAFWAGKGYAVFLGADAEYEDIRSEGLRSGVSVSALGSHVRRRASWGLEVTDDQAPLRWQIGLRLDSRSDYAPRVSRSAAASYDLSRTLTVRASAGTAFRIPTFTELYYADPFNLGSADLRPERGWAWDAGVDAERGPWRAALTFFARHEWDLIDWARRIGATDQVWRVLNIASGATRGSEALLGWRTPPGHAVTLSHAYWDKRNDLRSGYEGKYALIVPRHILSGEATAALSRRLRLTFTGRYLERTGGPSLYAVAFVLDGGLAYDWPGVGRVSLQATNLLDRRYEEIPGVPLAGRLLSVAIETRFR